MQGHWQYRSYGCGRKDFLTKPLVDNKKESGKEIPPPFSSSFPDPLVESPLVWNQWTNQLKNPSRIRVEIRCPEFHRDDLPGWWWQWGFGWPVNLWCCWTCLCCHPSCWAHCWSSRSQSTQDTAHQRLLALQVSLYTERPLLDQEWAQKLTVGDTRHHSGSY